MSSSVVRPRPSADVVADTPTADSNVDDVLTADAGEEVTSVLRKQTVAGLEGGGGGGNAGGGRLGGSRNHTGAVYVLSRKRKQFQVKFLIVFWDVELL
jgi:hypothetical protein